VDFTLLRFDLLVRFSAVRLRVTRTLCELSTPTYPPFVWEISAGRWRTTTELLLRFGGMIVLRKRVSC